MSSAPPYSISVPAAEQKEIRAKLTALIEDLSNLDGALVHSQSALFRAAVNGNIVSDNGETYLKVRIVGV